MLNVVLYFSNFDLIVITFLKKSKQDITVNKKCTISRIFKVFMSDKLTKNKKQ